MMNTDTACVAASARPDAERPAADARHGSRLGLTGGQRALAVATAVAILLSGLNAAVQVARVLVQCWTGRP